LSGPQPSKSKENYQEGQYLQKYSQLDLEFLIFTNKVSNLPNRLDYFPNRLFQMPKPNLIDNFALASTDNLFERERERAERFYVVLQERNQICRNQAIESFSRISSSSL
jgi:hypothetical protein